MRCYKNIKYKQMLIGLLMFFFFVTLFEKALFEYAYAQKSYVIETAVHNGTISKTKTGIKPNSLSTVSFSPKGNRYLVRVEVDGNPIPLKHFKEKINTKYDFKNVTQNHKIEVWYDVKAIKIKHSMDETYKPYGEQTCIYVLKDSFGNIKRKALNLTPQTSFVTFKNLRPDIYTVSVVDPVRVSTTPHELTCDLRSSNFNQKYNSAWKYDNQFEEKVISFKSNLNNYAGLSHSDLVINEFDSVKKNKTCKVVYDGNEGLPISQIETYNIETGALVSGKYESPIRKGYTFKYWTFDKLGKKETNREYFDKDVVLYAKWGINKYDIAYELEGGVNHKDNPKSYTVEDSIKLKPPKKEGYTFIGWTDDGIITKGSVGHKIFRATWKINKYYVDLNAILDGKPYVSGMNDFLQADIYINDKLIEKNCSDYCIKHDYGTNVKMIVRAKYGYEIISAAEFTGVVKDRISFYPEFKRKTYKVVWDCNGGTIDDKNSIVTSGKYKDIVTVPKVPTRRGYKFKGWNSTPTMYTSNMKAIAMWEPKIYNISYKLNGGQNNKSNPLTYTIEDSFSIKDPVKQGYDFIGWDKTNVIHEGTTGNLVYVANWKLQEHDVRIHSHTYSSTGWESDTTCAVWVDGKKITNSSWVGRGLNFCLINKETMKLEWQQKVDTHAMYNDSAKKELLSVKKKLKSDNKDCFLVVFLWDAGCVQATDELKAYGFPADFDKYARWGNTSERRPFIFMGYQGATAEESFINIGPHSDDTFLDDTIHIKDMEMQKTWHTITYKDGYNEQVWNKETVFHGFKPLYHDGLFVPTRTGFIFNGWTPRISNATSSLEYKATWKRKSYKITWDCSGGEINGNSSVNTVGKYQDKVIAPKNPVRKGYNFIGWDVVPNCYEDNCIVKAKWEPRKYNIVWDAGVGGTFKNNQRRIVTHITYGDKIVAPGEIPTKKYSTFKKWDIKDLDPYSETLLIKSVWDNKPVNLFIAASEKIDFNIPNIESQIEQRLAKKGYDYQVRCSTGIGKDCIVDASSSNDIFSYWKRLNGEHDFGWHIEGDLLIDNNNPNNITGFCSQASSMDATVINTFRIYDFMQPLGQIVRYRENKNGTCDFYLVWISGCSDYQYVGDWNQTSSTLDENKKYVKPAKGGPKLAYVLMKIENYRNNATGVPTIPILVTNKPEYIASQMGDISKEDYLNQQEDRYYLQSWGTNDWESASSIFGSTIKNPLLELKKGRKLSLAPKYMSGASLTILDYNLVEIPKSIRGSGHGRFSQKLFINLATDVEGNRIKTYAKMFALDEESLANQTLKSDQNRYKKMCNEAKPDPLSVFATDGGTPASTGHGEVIFNAKDLNPIGSGHSGFFNVSHEKVRVSNFSVATTTVYDAEGLLNNINNHREWIHKDRLKYLIQLSDDENKSNLNSSLLKDLTLNFVYENKTHHNKSEQIFIENMTQKIIKDIEDK